MLESDTVTKAAGDRVWLVADFGDLPELNEEPPQTITGQSIPDVPGLTIESVQLIGGYQVGAYYSGGAAGTTYTVICAVNLSGGGIISRNLPLKVE